jgi:hypothetical protein
MEVVKQIKVIDTMLKKNEEEKWNTHSIWTRFVHLV